MTFPLGYLVDRAGNPIKYGPQYDPATGNVSITYPKADGSLGIASLTGASGGFAPDAATLTTQLAPASYAGQLALVGAAPPFAMYQSDGSNWLLIPKANPYQMPAGAVDLSAYASISAARAQFTAVQLGDSLVANGTTVNSATSTWYTARNILQTACALLGGRLRALDAGVSGQRTDQFLARFATDVLPKRPGWVVIVGCSNDIDQGVAGTTIFANLMAIHALALSIGAQTLFVDTSAGGFSTQAAHTEWSTLHRLCIEQHWRGQGFFYQPMYRSAVDWTTSNNAQFAVAKSGILYDSVRHPSAFGVHTVYAQALYNFFNSVLPGFAPSQASARWLGPAGDLGGDTYILNGVFGGQAAGGTNDPSFWTSQVTGGITITKTVQSRTDGGLGMWVQHVLGNATAAADTATLQSGNSNNAGLLAGLGGKTIIAECDVDASASSGTIGQLDLTLTTKDSSSTVLTTSGSNTIVGTEYLGITAFKGRLRTFPMTVPANADRPQVTLKAGTSVGGAATVKWGDVRVYVLASDALM